MNAAKFLFSPLLILTLQPRLRRVNFSLLIFAFCPQPKTYFIIPFCGRQSRVCYAINGLAKEHGIPLVKIRCMTDKSYKKVEKIWQGQAPPYGLPSSLLAAPRQAFEQYKKLCKPA
jgi:hypothetical protein